MAAAWCVDPANRCRAVRNLARRRAERSCPPHIDAAARVLIQPCARWSPAWPFWSKLKGLRSEAPAGAAARAQRVNIAGDVVDD